MERFSTLLLAMNCWLAVEEVMPVEPSHLPLETPPGGLLPRPARRAERRASRLPASRMMSLLAKSSLAVESMERLSTEEPCRYTLVACCDCGSETLAVDER